MITKYFHPTRITASVLRCQPSLDWERMQGFQTQKRLYNCRCLSIIITFFKIFCRKNNSTFVNVRPSSSLSSKMILINWKKFSSHLSVFSDAIKGRLQKKRRKVGVSWEKPNVLISRHLFCGCVSKSSLFPGCIKHVTKWYFLLLLATARLFNDIIFS